MQRLKRKTNMLGLMMMFNFAIFIVVSMFRNSGPAKTGVRKSHVPANKFWKKSEISNAFWNREQQQLDNIYNPLFVTSNESGLEQSHAYRPNNTVPLEFCEPDHRVTTLIKDFDTLPQRFKDFLLYMRCRTFPVVKNASGVCSEPPFLLLAVKTLAPHFDRRQAIRESWGRAGLHGKYRVATVFLLGNTSSSDHYPDLSGMLEHEAAAHGDILQWDYRDSFFNLTVKEVLFLQWLSYSCQSARYVFKGDDDVFVNTRLMLTYLGGLSGTQARDLFVGDVITKAGPHRDPKLKYYIPESVYKGPYPPYAGGGGFLYSGSVALRLLTVSQHILLYPIDDVYTGMCLQRLGLVPEKHKGFKTFNIDEKYRENACAYQSLMLVHPRSPQEMIKIWSWISDPQLKCL
ncbi:N-acetyllactosaminide beta-1,3-N-acetylglucosaminyltransferase 2a [Chanos chanos]|uniref:Hexosyltransferase n=1 Tax=Chanos chanos TaxID=29144 RepID=A0A6J2VWR3_CHACN|nr:N-acetyllactosaminide beta-1,3-N-acetylglucosaminyltransferase 2-like [Chanos chanos]